MKLLLQKIFYLFLPITIGSLIGFIIKDSIHYDALILPPFSPKSIVFPIVWSIIYLLIGIAYYFYRKRYCNSKAIIIYYVQLYVNFTWPILFFIYRCFMFSAIWIMILILFVLILIFLFYKSEKRSFYAFLPYLIWLLFAFYLNFGIYLLN